MSEQVKKPDWTRLLLASGFIAFVPKCFACVVGYLALAGGLTAQVPELCGVGANETAFPAWVPGVAAGVIIIGVSRFKRQGGARPPDAR